MTNRSSRALPNLSLFASLLLGLVLLTWLFLTYNTLVKVADLWFDFSQEAEVLHTDTFELVSALGYGGMIHDYKNYVIRKDDLAYDKSVNRFEEIYLKLSTIENKIKDIDEFRAIHRLKTIVDLYRGELDKAKELITQGHSTESIDLAVRIDDTPATEALSQLRELSARNYNLYQAELSQQLEDLFFKLLLGGALVIPLVMYGLFLRATLTRVNDFLVVSAHQAEDLEAMLKASMTGAISVDDKGKIRLVNQYAERLTGYDAADLLGQPIELLVPTEVANMHLNLTKDYITSPKARAMAPDRKVQMKTKSGDLKEVEIRLTPINLRGELQVVASFASNY